MQLISLVTVDGDLISTLASPFQMIDILKTLHIQAPYNYLYFLSKLENHVLFNILKYALSVKSSSDFGILKMFKLL